MTLAATMRSDVSSVFLDTDEHAESVTYSPRGSSTTSTIKAIVERLATESMTDERGTSLRKMAFFHIADTTRPSEGDKLAVGGVTYRVDGITTDDGFGMLRVAAIEMTPQTATVNITRRTA